MTNHMKKLNIILTVLLMMSIMTGCGTKPVTTAVEVAERYLTSDRYENYHMDGFMTVTTTFSSDDELSFEAPVTVSISEDVHKDAGDRQVYVCEDGEWRKSESSTFDYAVLTDITSDIFEESELTVIDTEDDVIYSVVVPMSKMMHNENIADIFEGTSLACIMSSNDFDKLFSDVSVVYTFDKNCNLTSISCDCVEINSTVIKDDTSYDMTMTVEFSYIFSDFGEMSEQNTMTPEAIDAAPDEVEPPETEILIEK